MMDNGSKEKNVFPRKFVTPLFVSAFVLYAAVALTLAYVLPSSQIKRAFISTRAELTERKNIMEAIAVPNIKGIIDSGEYSSVMDVKIKNNSVDESLNDMSLKLALNSDKDNETLGIALAVSYAGMLVGDVTAYTDNENIILAFPSLFDKAFKFKCEDIPLQYASSPLGVAEGYTYNESSSFSIKPFSDDSVTNKLDNSIDIINAICKKAKLYNRLYLSKAVKNASFEVLDEKDISLGNKKYECKGYRYTLTGKATGDYVRNMVNNLAADEISSEAELAIADYLFNTVEVNRYYYRDSAAMSEELRQIKEKYVREICASRFGEARLSFYLCGGRVMEASIRVPITNENGTHDIRLSFTLNGENKPTDGFNCILSCGGTKTNFNINYSEICEQNGDIINQANILKITDGSGATGSYSIGGSYNTASGEISASAESTSVEGITNGLNIKGSIIPKNGILTADLNDVNLDVFNQTFALDVIYDLRYLSSPIPVPDTEAVEIFKISESDAKQNIKEAEGALCGIRFIGDILKALYQT